MHYDFVALGDVTTDAFIRLTDAEEHLEHGMRELCVRFGEKIPYEEFSEIRAVGNAANAAVSAHRIGLSSALVSWVGDDENGAKTIQALQERGVPGDFITIEKGKRTNYHFVLMFGAERTILIKHEQFDYHLPDFPAAPRYLYFSSISEHSLSFHGEVAANARAHPETKLVFQPGTFQIKLGARALKNVYEATELFFCNKEEAQYILETAEANMKKLLAGIRALGPRTAIITDGRNGAFLADSSGAYAAPMYPDPAPPQNRTGAGDATASTMTAYIARGMDAKDALLRGLINAAAVVQHIGAQTGLLTDREIEEWFAKRPADFAVRPL